MSFLYGEFTLEEEGIINKDNTTFTEELKIFKRMLTFIPYDLINKDYKGIRFDIKMLKEQLKILYFTLEEELV